MALFFLIVAAPYWALAVVISIAILIPIFMLSMRQPSRPSEWWFFGIAFLVTELVLVAISAIKDEDGPNGAVFVLGLWPGLLMGMFGALWHMSCIGYPTTEPIGTAVARVILVLYLAGVLFGSIKVLGAFEVI